MTAGNDRVNYETARTLTRQSFLRELADEFTARVHELPSLQRVRKVTALSKQYHLSKSNRETTLCLCTDRGHAQPKSLDNQQFHLAEVKRSMLRQLAVSLQDANPTRFDQVGGCPRGIQRDCDSLAEDRNSELLPSAMPQTRSGRRVFARVRPRVR